MLFRSALDPNLRPGGRHSAWWRCVEVRTEPTCFLESRGPPSKFIRKLAGHSDQQTPISFVIFDLHFFPFRCEPGKGRGARFCMRLQKTTARQQLASVNCSGTPFLPQCSILLICICGVIRKNPSPVNWRQPFRVYIVTRPAFHQREDYRG